MTKMVKANLNNIIVPSNILFLGMTGSGKTYAFVQLWNSIWKKDFDLLYVISPTAGISNDFAGVNCHLMQDLDLVEVKIEEFCELQKVNKKKGKKFNIMIVIDDCIGAVNLTSSFFSQFFATARHLNITTVLMMQNITKYMGPTLRNNLSYIFLNRISDTNLQVLFDLTGCWETKKELKTFMTNNLVNYNTIFIDKRSLTPVEPLVFRA